jgi:Fe(3+) dicitrate transport protein
MLTKSQRGSARPNLTQPAMRLLACSIAAWLSTGTAYAADAADGAADTTAKNAGDPHSVVINADKDKDKPWLRNIETKRAHLLPEVDGTMITVTKKNSVVKLDEQPTVIDANLREMFARMPGLQVSEQQTPGHGNMNYRGIGNPQEAEYVLSLQDGIPIVSDWIGVPTLYYLPIPQTLGSVQMIRGGSNLLYGPEPGPTVNYVSRRPDESQPLRMYTENTFGSHRLFSTYNEVSGTTGDSADWEYMADLSHRKSDGERANAGYKVTAGDVHLGYHIDASQKIEFDLHGYAADNNDPGRMSFTQYAIDRDTTTTPYNKVWVDRTTAVLTYDYEFDKKNKVTAKFWTGEQVIDQRSAANFVPPQPAPTTTTIDHQRFNFTGIDTRVRRSWGKGHAFTAGFVYYDSTSPWRQYVNSNLLADRSDTSGTKRLMQDRSTKYAAVFAESVFRAGQFHIVPSVRYEREEIAIDETVKPTAAPLNKNTYRRNVPLFGLGVGNDFGVGHESYVNVSQGYRPLRYLDVASPFSNLSSTNNPDPSTSISYEAGIHAWPYKGFYYDVSLFEVDFKNRIESIKINNTDSVNRNSGDSRHRGFEAEISYDLFAQAPSAGNGEHLTLFGNLSLLNATFTASILPGRVGATPAYSPKYLARAGAIWSRDKHYKLSLSAVSVARQFWQDSDQSSGSGASFIPAEIPQYTVFDLTGDYQVTGNVRILGGITNLADRQYYSRVFGNGLEPANRRSLYLGISIGM